MSEEMSREDIIAYLQGIIAENRDHPPLGHLLNCSRCQKNSPKDALAACKKYPLGIPREILLEEVPCEDFQAKE